MYDRVSVVGSQIDGFHDGGRILTCNARRSGDAKSTVVRTSSRYGAKIGSGENTSSEQIHSNRSRSDSVRGAPYISPRRNGSNTLHFATKERFSVLIDWRRARSRSGPVLGRAEPQSQRDLCHTGSAYSGDLALRASAQLARALGIESAV